VGTVCFADDLASANVSRLRALGVVKEGMTQVVIAFPDGVDRVIGIRHTRFPNGGGWSFFVCPRCGGRARILRLYDGKRPMCRACCLRNGARYRIAGGSPAERAEARAQRIEKLRARLEGGPARLNPRPGRTLDRKGALEFSLRRALIATRQGLLAK
jgi:hypothetical protein